MIHDVLHRNLSHMREQLLMCLRNVLRHKENILFMLHKINYQWVLKDGAMMSVEPAVSFLQSNSLFDDETSDGISISFWTLSGDVVSLVIQKCYLRLCWPEVHLTLHSHPTSINRNHWELWLRDCTCKQKYLIRCANWIFHLSSLPE